MGRKRKIKTQGIRKTWHCRKIKSKNVQRVNQWHSLSRVPAWRWRWWWWLWWCRWCTSGVLVIRIVLVVLLNSLPYLGAPYVSLLRLLDRVTAGGIVGRRYNGVMLMLLLLVLLMVRVLLLVVVLMRFNSRRTWRRIGNTLWRTLPFAVSVYRVHFLQTFQRIRPSWKKYINFNISTRFK